MGDVANTIGAFVASLLLGRQRGGRVSSGLTGSGPGIVPAGEPIERRSAPYEDEGITIAALPDRFILPPTMADAILEICHQRGTCDRFGGADMTLALAPMLLGISNSAPAAEEEEASAGGSSSMRWRDITALFTTTPGSFTDAALHQIVAGNLSHGQGVFYLVQIWITNQAVGGNNICTITFRRGDGTILHTLTFTVTNGNTLNGYLRAWLSLNPTEENVYNLMWGEFHRTEDATGGSTIANSAANYQGHTHNPGLEPFAPPPGDVPINISAQSSVATSTVNIQAIRIYKLG